MATILPYYPPYASRIAWLKHLRRCRDAKLHRRYLIVINLLHRRGAYDIAEQLKVLNTTVYRVAKRFREQGEVGLLDAREDNGEVKLDERFLTTTVPDGSLQPEKHNWPRPTWTRELLVETLASRTGSPHSSSHDESGPSSDQGAPRTPTPSRRLSVVRKRQKSQTGGNPAVSRRPAPATCGVLRRRSGHPPQS